MPVKLGRMPVAAAQFYFPAGRRAGGTGMVVDSPGDRLPTVRWMGAGNALPAGQVCAAAGPRGAPLLVEHAHGTFTRPGLRGHRSGRDWSPRFQPDRICQDRDLLVIEASDRAAGLALRTEVEATPGGGLRSRHRVTNTGATPYYVDGLEVVYPVPDHFGEALDLTGRHGGERSPQRHLVGDGLWLRESRRGRPGLNAATVMAVGETGFGFGSGQVMVVHVAWSGNSVLRLERDPQRGTSVGGGELLWPGEVVLAPGESYTSPWVWVWHSAEGLDGAAAAVHAWLRSLPSHPVEVPVTLNVWEAVYFDHRADRLHRLARLAATVGVERFVLDDGWFLGRRSARSGLGDWEVDPEVWPDGLGPLSDQVRALGMQFGLWFEPEMVNPDSDLYRRHPDWVLSTGDRIPLLQRHQLVLDLSRPEVRAHLVERMDRVISTARVDYVKWDHNRDLLDAGSGRRAGAPGVHDQTVGFLSLLDELRRRHPAVQWESCASGGGRVDLDVLSRVQRIWTSDMTDALARQGIQRWTLQIAAPEYLGAHVSAPVSHQTGRALPLDLRAATALVGSFGIEWDLEQADPSELERLAEWVALYKRHRRLLHTGRIVRPDAADPAVTVSGVVSADRSQALLCHVQMDESVSERGSVIRVPSLLDGAAYRVEWIHPRVPDEPAPATGSGSVLDAGVLAAVGVWVPRCRPQTARVLHLVAERAGALPDGQATTPMVEPQAEQ